MDERDLVLLKRQYVLFEEADHICLYDKNTKMVILKLKAGKGALDEKAKDELSRPQTIKWLSKRPYWKWFGIILQKYPDYFDMVEKAEVNKLTLESDYFSVVDRTHFAENYNVEYSFHDTRIILFGDTKINRALYQDLLEVDSNLVVVEKEVDSFALESFEKEAIANREVISENQIDSLQVNAGDIVLFDATGMKEEELLKWNQYFTKRETATLFYGNGLENIQVGPLVIGGECACLECMKKDDVLKKYYCGESGYVDRISMHAFLLFILRTVYYIKGNNLFYLLSDSQIPINKVFVIQKKDLSARLDYIYRNVDCECNR